MLFWIISSHHEVADPKNGVANPKNFDAEGYGKCKVECYTKQSYIRQVLGHGKYKSIISCNIPDVHSRVCRRLVEHVKAGKSRKDLWVIRDKLANEPVAQEDVE